MTRQALTILLALLLGAFSLPAQNAYTGNGTAGGTTAFAGNGAASYTGAGTAAYTGTEALPPDFDPDDPDAIPEGYELIDTVIYVPAVAVDSTLVGKDIFRLLGTHGRGEGTVRISQSGEILSAMDSHMVNNAAKTLTGYRVRIFFDNKQTSRSDSEATMNRFKETFPEVPVYWSYVNPYFKLTVGDFRTRSEAMQLLSRLKNAFPAAFIVKEAINYPALDKEHAMVPDSVRVLRPIPGYEEVPEDLVSL